jgi:hypothetical protein
MWMPALKSTRLRPAVSLGWVILRPGPTNRHNLRQIGIGRPFRVLKRTAARPAFVLRGVSPSTRVRSLGLRGKKVKPGSGVPEGRWSRRRQWSV